MGCKITLEITNYDKTTGKTKLIPDLELGSIQNDQQLTVDLLAQAIANLSKEARSTLAAQLRAAKVQSTSAEDIQKREILSNITLDELTKQYPELEKYGIPKDLQYSPTLLRCYKAEFNGSMYKGRAVDSKGNEVFIINNFWDADKLFKHLSAKLNLAKFIQGNDIDESLKQYAEDLVVIANRYKRTVQKLIEDFLVDKNHFTTFRYGDKLYSPKRLINKVLSQVTQQVYDEGDKSDLQLELEAAKEYTGNNNEWKFEKKKLYDVLVTFVEDFEKTYPFDVFKDLSSEALNQILSPIFENDVRLIKATVKSATTGKKVIKDTPKEIRRKNLSKADLQKLYKTAFEGVEDAPKTIQAAAQKYKEGFMQAMRPMQLTYTDNQGVSHEIQLEMDEEYNVTAFYEYEVEPKVVEKSSYITLDMHNWATIGEIYNFGYDSQPIFKLTEEYKGFYIYEFHKEGATHYAVSRSVISPKAYMKTFSSLDFAKQNIDSNQDTLEECGLWSIKQHTGRPRVSELEMKGIRVGQIITTLDLQIPYYQYKHFSDSVKKLFEGTVQNFHQTLKFIPNITKLDTPEKAAAFIYLAHKALKTNQDFFKAMEENKEAVQNIIKIIDEADTISYLVEKETKYGSRTEYHLKLLQNHGDNINLEGTFNDVTIQTFMDQSLTEAITYFNKSFGINIHAVTRSELEQFSKENNLKLEGKLDVVKAFVYNGEIYINTSNANVENLFHELSHIFLGILKAKDFDMYQEIIDEYTKKSNFAYQFREHKKAYQYYSEQDIIEESVADMIAEDMFKNKSLGGQDFNGDAFMQLFEDIMKKSKRFLSMEGNGLDSFSKNMKRMLDENGDAMQRNMQISELVRQYIEDGTITEIC